MPLTVKVTRIPHGSSIVFPMTAVPADPVPVALISGDKGRIVTSSVTVIQVDVWVIWKKLLITYAYSLLNDESASPANSPTDSYPQDRAKIGVRWEIDYPSLTPVLLEVVVRCDGGAKGLVEIEVMALPRGAAPPTLPPADLTGTSYHSGTITC